MIATLHDSVFVKKMQPTKLTICLEIKEYTGDNSLKVLILFIKHYHTLL
jgi:hypothetical protein